MAHVTEQPSETSESGASNVAMEEPGGGRGLLGVYLWVFVPGTLVSTIGPPDVCFSLARVFPSRIQNSLRRTKRAIDTRHWSYRARVLASVCTLLGSIERVEALSCYPLFSIHDKT